MIDKLQRFKEIALVRNVEVCLPTTEIGEVNNDRELIKDFLPDVQDILAQIIAVEERNSKMKVLANRHTYEKKGDLDKLI